MCQSVCTGYIDSSLEARKLQEKYALLEEQNSRLAAELTNAIEHSNELCEKVVLAEMTRDRLRERLAKITVDTGLVRRKTTITLKDLPPNR